MAPSSVAPSHFAFRSTRAEAAFLLRQGEAAVALSSTLHALCCSAWAAHGAKLAWLVARQPDCRARLGLLVVFVAAAVAVELRSALLAWRQPIWQVCNHEQATVRSQLAGMTAVLVTHTLACPGEAAFWGPLAPMLALALLQLLAQVRLCTALPLAMVQVPAFAFMQWAAWLAARQPAAVALPAAAHQLAAYLLLGQAAPLTLAAFREAKARLEFLADCGAQPELLGAFWSRACTWLPQMEQAAGAGLATQAKGLAPATLQGLATAWQHSSMSKGRSEAVRPRADTCRALVPMMRCLPAVLTICCAGTVALALATSLRPITAA